MNNQPFHVRVARELSKKRRNIDSWRVSRYMRLKYLDNKGWASERQIFRIAQLKRDLKKAGVAV